MKLLVLIIAAASAFAWGAVRQAELCADGTYHQLGYCPADLSSPGFQNVGSDSVESTVTIDRDDGTWHACVTTSNTPLSGPDIETCSGSPAVAGSSEGAGEEGFSSALEVLSLSSSTTYYVQNVHKNPSGWYSDVVVSDSFTTGSADATAPTVSSANVPAGANSLVVDYSENVSQGAAYADSDWTISATNGAFTLTYSSGNDTNQHTFSTSRAVAEGETITLDWAGTADGLEDGAGNDLAAFSGQSVTNNVGGSALFSDDFDALTAQDINGRCRFEGDTNDSNGDGTADCNQVPTSWDFIYTSQNNSTNPPCAIATGSDRSGTGKSLKAWDESYGDSNSWGHDCQLAKHTEPTQYSELWISMYIKFNSGIDTTDFNAAKIFRMGHYNPAVIDGTTGTSVVNTNKTTTEGLTTGGLMFYDVKKVSSTIWRHKISVRCNPDYKCGTYDEAWEIEFKDANGTFADRTWTGTYGDGAWHKFEIRMVMNSANGVGDGILELYFDGVYQGGRTNIPWINGTPTHTINGFNMFTLAGNADALWAGQTNAEQHFYDIDDVQICESRCP